MGAKVGAALACVAATLAFAGRARAAPPLQGWPANWFTAWPGEVAGAVAVDAGDFGTATPGSADLVVLDMAGNVTVLPVNTSGFGFGQPIRLGGAPTVARMQSISVGDIDRNGSVLWTRDRLETLLSTSTSTPRSATRPRKTLTGATKSVRSEPDGRFALTLRCRSRSACTRPIELRTIVGRVRPLRQQARIAAGKTGTVTGRLDRRARRAAGTRRGVALGVFAAGSEVGSVRVREAPRG